MKVIRYRVSFSHNKIIQRKKLELERDKIYTPPIRCLFDYIRKIRPWPALKSSRKQNARVLSSRIRL